MQGNPFYIDPFGGYGGQIVEGLSGLGAVLGERQKMKQAEEKRKTVGLEASRLLREGTPDEVYQFSLQNPEISKMIDDRMGYLNKESRQNAFQTALQISQGANPIDAYGKRIEYLKSIGANPAETMQELEDAAFQYAEDPEGYRNLVARTIPAAFMPEYGEYRKVMKPMEGEKLTGNMANTALAMFGTADVSRLTPEQRQAVQMETQRTGGGQAVPAKIAEWQQYQELKKTNPEEAMAFGQAAGFVDKNGKLSAFAEKQLSTATNEAVEATTNVERFNALADEIEAADFGGGLFGGSWREKLKDVTGQQDIVTELRRKFNAVKSSQVVQNLPPGAASDADIALALSGFPSDNYNAEQLASFMRGLSKVEGLRAQFAEFKANYISENKNESGLLRAWKAQTGQGGGGSQSPSNFSESDFAAAAKQAGVSVEEFRKIVGQ